MAFGRLRKLIGGGATDPSPATVRAESGGPGATTTPGPGDDTSAAAINSSHSNIKNLSAIDGAAPAPAAVAGEPLDADATERVKPVRLELEREAPPAIKNLSAMAGAAPAPAVAGEPLDTPEPADASERMGPVRVEFKREAAPAEPASDSPSPGGASDALWPHMHQVASAPDGSAPPQGINLDSNSNAALFNPREYREGGPGSAGDLDGDGPPEYAPRDALSGQASAAATEPMSDSSGAEQPDAARWTQQEGPLAAAGAGDLDGDGLAERQKQWLPANFRTGAADGQPVPETLPGESTATDGPTAVAINLNSSKSNIYRESGPGNAGDLDGDGLAERQKQWTPANFRTGAADGQPAPETLPGESTATDEPTGVAINLNSSKSNIYRESGPGNAGDLDSDGPADYDDEPSTLLDLSAVSQSESPVALTEMDLDQPDLGMADELGAEDADLETVLDT